VSKNHIRGALYRRHIGRGNREGKILRRMDGGHALPLGIEGKLAHAGDRVFGKTRLKAGHHQGAFRGIPNDSESPVFLAQLRVVAEEPDP
jgi:hypothetical protein